jgi:hypothetical protein
MNSILHHFVSRSSATAKKVLLNFPQEMYGEEFKRVKGICTVCGSRLNSKQVTTTFNRFSSSPVATGKVS